MDLTTQFAESLFEYTPEDTSVRAAAKCEPGDVPCVLDGLYPNRSRVKGDPIRCKDVRGFFEVMDAMDQLRQIGNVKYAAYGPNARAIFPGGETYTELAPCETACETNNFQSCRIVTPPGTNREATGALERRQVFSSSQVGFMSGDTAADIKDEQRTDGRFLTSSSAYDFEAKRIKRTPVPLSLTAALLYAGLGVGAAYIIRTRKG